ncbi:MAG TPA: helix-turn-helix transcriptional regulator [Arenibaculum sp.]|nr:helix-turn-helix transcriptional regulator [Arenibaculum sp.]
MTTMVSGITIAEVAGLIGDVARANILSALMDGRALTAGELAWHAGVSAQTTSGHLAKLAAARLVAVEKQGRHRYYRLFDAEVAHAVEALMAVAATGPARHRPTGPRDEALRTARTCYDHLAGYLGTALADTLHARGHIVLGDGAGEITADGAGFLSGFGIDAAGLRNGRRTVCRTCLDWSERRPHLAGGLGAALCARCFELGWIERMNDSRAVAVTAAGRSGFGSVFGVPFPRHVTAGTSPRTT